MINGVLEIVAAVLFAVIALGKDMDMIWFTIAAVYLVCGILNLIVHTVKNYRKQKAAEKAAAEKASKKAAEKAAAEKEAAEKAAAELAAKPAAPVLPAGPEGKGSDG